MLEIIVTFQHAEWDMLILGSESWNWGVGGEQSCGGGGAEIQLLTDTGTKPYLVLLLVKYWNW